MTASLDGPNPYAAPPKGEFDPAEEFAPVPTVPNTLHGKFQAAFTLFAADIAIFAPLVLFINLPASVVTNYYLITNPGRETEAKAFILGLLVSIFFSPIPLAGMLYTLKRRMLGEPVSLFDSLSQGMNHWLPLLFAQIVKWMILLTGFLPLVVPGFYFAARLALLDPVVVLERPAFPRFRKQEDGDEATGVGWDLFGPHIRSNHLVRGKGWEIFCAMMIFILGLLMISIALAKLPRLEDPPLDMAIACARDNFLELLASVNCVLMFLYYWEAVGAKVPAPEEELD